MTFAEEIEEAANGEEIEGIVVSVSREDDDEADPQPVKEWDEARGGLDYQYDAGLGMIDCHAITVWTRSRVIFVERYDGATGVVWLPRNPFPHVPQRMGGG